MKSMHKFILMGSGFLLAAGATNADASGSGCASVLSSYNYYASPSCTSSPGYTSCSDSAGQLVANNPECFGGSSTTSQTQISATSVQHSAAISNAISARTLGASPMSPQTAGSEAKSMAAGGKNAAFNVWASGTVNSTEQNYTSSTNTIVKNDSDIRTKLVGGDYAISPTMALGLSLAFDSGDGGSATNSFTSTGYIIAPYLGLQILNDLAADISFGIGRGEMDMTGGLSTESDRMFAAANLSYSKWYGNTQLTGKLGYLHAEEKYENTKVSGVAQDNTSATNKMDQMRAGVQAGYWLNGFMPYLGLAYVNDIQRSTTQICAKDDPIGKDALQWTAGINFISIANSLTAGLVYSQEQGRSNQDNDVIMANINYRF